MRIRSAGLKKKNVCFVYIYDFKIQNNKNKMSLILSGPWTVASADYERKSGRGSEKRQQERRGEPVSIFFKYLSPLTNPPTSRKTFFTFQRPLFIQQK